MENNQRKENIARFEAEMSKVQRPGVDKLMEYIRNSDFYDAPASTRYHLSCKGGLLQHSLNVLDALRGMMADDSNGTDEKGKPKIVYHYAVAGQIIATISEESLIIIALLHDICKTYFYSTSTRNVKNEQTGKWEKAPYYMVNDKMPLGHGPKSAMIVKEYIDLSSEEMYAIWWHMGFSDTGGMLGDAAVLNQAIGKYPIIWAVHTADMMASHFMEEEKENAAKFICQDTGSDASQWADAPTVQDGSEFMEALPYATN